MNGRLVAAGLALIMIASTAASLGAPGSTEEVPRATMTHETRTVDEAEANAVTADLDVLASIVTEARKDVSLGADPSETLERLTSQKSVGFIQLGTAWLTAEDVEDCRSGKVVWKISFWGGIVDGCDPTSMWTDPFGAQSFAILGWWMGTGHAEAVFASCAIVECLWSEHYPGPGIFEVSHDNPEIDRAFNERGRAPVGVVLGELTGRATQHAGGFSTSVQVDFIDDTLPTLYGGAAAPWTGNPNRYTGTWAPGFTGTGPGFAVGDLSTGEFGLKGPQPNEVLPGNPLDGLPQSMVIIGDAPGIHLTELDL